MIGLSGIALKLAAGAAIVAIVGGYIGWLKWDLADRDKTIAEQRVAITEAVAAYQQEHKTALANAAALSRLEQMHDAAVKARIEAQASLSAERKRSTARVKEISRAPSANDPLPAALRPLLGVQ